MAYQNQKVRARQTVAPNKQVKTLGIVSNVPMGEWSATTEYLKLNIVRYKDATYQAKKQNKGFEPTVTQGWQEIWQLIAKDGRGIVYTEITYQASISNSVPPNGDWSNSIPNVPQGQYLWTRMIYTFTDGTQATSYAISLQGLNFTQQDRDDLNWIKTITPSSATKNNPLTTKDFVNSSINNMAAFYITYNASGDAFPTRNSLFNATTYYYGGKVRVPTQNDYAIVLADESQPTGVDGKYPTTRYSYQGDKWSFQYVVNNTSLTQAQLDAINSGITQQLVAKIGNEDHLIVKDIRNTEGATGQFPSYSFTPIFNANGSPYGNDNWYSGFHINGWTTDTYMGWDLIGYSGNRNVKDEPIHVRSSYKNSVGAWRQIYDSVNIPDHMKVEHGNEMNGFYKCDTSHGWINYRGAPQTITEIRFGNGAGNGGYTSLRAYKYIAEGGGLDLISTSAAYTAITYTVSGTTFSPIKFYPGDQYGAGVVIGAGGLTIIGSGESADMAKGSLPDATTESMYVCADESVHLCSNLQNSFSDRKEALLDASGNFTVAHGDIFYKNYSLSFAGLKRTVIDASGLDNNTWYPVTMSVDTAERGRILLYDRLNGAFTNNVPWSTHNSHDIAYLLYWDTTGSGWGNINECRNVYMCQWRWGDKIFGRIGQLTNSSIEYIFVRGGAKYQIFTSANIGTPTLQTTTYTVNNQSVSPTTTYPEGLTQGGTYTANNKPKASDVGALPISGGSMTGKLTLQYKQIGINESGLDANHSNISGIKRLILAPPDDGTRGSCGLITPQQSHPSKYDSISIHNGIAYLTIDADDASMKNGLRYKIYSENNPPPSSGGGGGGVTGYDLVITTQEEFESFVDACFTESNPYRNVLLAERLDGGGDQYELYKSLDLTGCLRFSGAGGVRIHIGNDLEWHGRTEENAAICAVGQGNFLMESEIFNISVDVDARFPAIVFMGFNRVVNCSVSREHSDGITNDNYASGFFRCSNLVNCFAYYYCTSDETFSCFRECSCMVNCYGETEHPAPYVDQSYCFYDCRYASNCMASTGGSGATGWGGANEKISTETCNINE